MVLSHTVFDRISDSTLIGFNIYSLVLFDMALRSGALEVIEVQRAYMTSNMTC